MLKIAGEKDAVALYFVAEAHFAGGDKAKAKEFEPRQWPPRILMG